MRDKPSVLWLFLSHFIGNATISFEGDLKELPLASFPGATFAPSTVLQRQTISPILDFVVLPVTEESIRFLKRTLDRGGLFNDGGALLHIQLASNDQLVFGAFDNFHRECVFAAPPTPVSLLTELKRRGFIRSFSSDGKAGQSHDQAPN